MKLSVFVITLNEEKRLAGTLEAAAKIADQIVLVDSGSYDNTLEIARSFGAEVSENEFEGYGQQKRFAEDKCENDWVLNLDADEVLTPALIDEIKQLKTETQRNYSGYFVRILNVYPGVSKPRPFANDYNVVRLYSKSTMRYRDHPTFDRVEVDAGQKVGQLSAPIYHYPVVSLRQMVAKLDAYADRQAQISNRPKWKIFPRIPLEYPLQFFKYMILRRHIFGGWRGIQFSHELSKSKVRRLLKLI